MSPALSSTQPDPTPSIPSIPSTSSLASGTSLARRSRTRTRSKTVTGGPLPPPPPPPPPPARSEEPPPLPVPSPVPSHSTDSTTQQHRYGSALSSQHHGFLHPPSGSLRSASSDHTSQGDSAVGEVTLVAPVAQPSPVSGKISKAARLASHLASIETSLNPLPSAFERDPHFTSNARDSISTIQSGTSSSFYPPSTSTFSGPESPSSPRTVTEDISHPIISSPAVAEDPGEMQQYAGDDVAYRLRLLVNNNYFLPPAHMKPSPEDFATAVNAKKPPKPQTSTFLDIFRIGKSKSKPTTPTSPAFDIPPMLRTTSDSIAVSRALRSHTLPTPHASGLPHHHLLDKGRVVVVRERMDDITVAAKQSEQEMKNRGARPAHSPIRPRKEVDDVIDPTDAVDIPLPGANYPFAVQASALHGLGVHESVGAAVLAERLPPDNSNVSSSTDPDNHWRKALLHEAVYHSLDTTPDISTFSHPIGTSPILGSRVNDTPPRESTPTNRAKRLQQRIISTQPSTDLEDSFESNEPRRKSTSTRASTSKNDNKLLTTPDSTDSRRSSYLPMRMATPVGTWTPLSPAPRRQAMNPNFSISQADLQDLVHEGDSSVSPKYRLRRSMSTPMLTEGLEEMREFVMTPSPPPLPSTRRSSQMTSRTLSYEASHDRPSFNSAFSSRANSHYDLHDMHDQHPRNSAVPSIMAARPSISSYSQASLSPSTSAFQDALNRPEAQSDVSSIHPPSEVHLSHEDLTARSSLASPPPRMSSSFVHIALHPPPRSSSFNYSTALAQASRSNTSEPRIQVSAPSPAASPSRPNPLSLTVDIPSTMDSVAIHSPAPSSPTSFFDTIQSHPNAMDDLDSSSEDSDEADDARESSSQPSPFGSDIRTRANSAVSPRPAKLSIMKLGNFSTPYINRSGVGERSRALPGQSVDNKKALGYTPTKATFFAERKNDFGHGSELTGLDIARSARGQGQPPPASASTTTAAAQPVAGLSSLAEVSTPRPATASQLQVSQVPRKRESVMRLDGMLLQHMEAEKDRIRKIASSLKASTSNTSLIS